MSYFNASLNLALISFMVRILVYVFIYIIDNNTLNYMNRVFNI